MTPDPMPAYSEAATDAFLKSCRKNFAYYKSLGDRTFDQLSEEELLSPPVTNSNSIAILVNHLWGNMRSRWTDFLTEDGEKDWRERDTEFMPIINSKAALLKKWEEGWACLFTALDSIDHSNFDQQVYIRRQAHSIPEAIHRQLAHYAMHVGQIIYIGKMTRGAEWTSLSIPLGKSAEFNARKTRQGTHGGHFTDDLMSKK